MPYVHFREISSEIKRQPFRVFHSQICPRTPFVRTVQPCTPYTPQHQKESNSRVRGDMLASAQPCLSMRRRVVAMVTEARAGSLECGVVCACEVGRGTEV